MPTPACLATAVIGAAGSATKTARAESRMRWSLRAASAWRPLIGPWGCRRLSIMGFIVPGLGMKHSVLLDCGTEDFVPIAGGDSDGRSTDRTGAVDRVRRRHHGGGDGP